jgi:hypothetical protein
MNTKHIIINGDSRQMSEFKDKSIHLKAALAKVDGRLEFKSKNKFISI